MIKMVSKIFCIATMLSNVVIADSKVNKPTEVVDFINTTVMITNKEQTSGGTGVIYTSSTATSQILTNAHICRLLSINGGVVQTKNSKYTVEKYKISKVHDMCLIEVVANLGVQVKIAEGNLNFGDKLIISGHPYLLPTTVTEGHLSGTEEIQLLVDVQKCTAEEVQKDPFLCFWFDGMPLIQSFQSNTTSVMIAPGNSGSGVFNSKGELVGLAFAGIGRGISHGFVVPLEYIKTFLNEETKSLEWKTLSGAKKFVELESESESNKTVLHKKLTLPSRENIEKLYYPEIKDSSIDTLVEKLDLCRKGLERCVRN